MKFLEILHLLTLFEGNDSLISAFIIFTVVYNAGFQFLDLCLSNPILSSSIMAASFVRNQILLLRPFIKYFLKSGSAKDTIIRFDSSSIVTEEIYVLTSEENEIVISA